MTGDHGVRSGHAAITNVVLRRVILIVPPLVLAVVLWWHPTGGDRIYEGVRDDVAAWMFVHTVFLLFIPLLGLAGYVLVSGLSGLAATVSRVSLLLFLVFYTAYEVSVGVGTGILVDYANGLPAAEQEVVADAIQHYNRSDLVGDPASVSLLLGFFGWVVGMLAAAVAFQRAGAGWLITVLLGTASLFAIHPPPVGPVGLACFAAGAWLVERWRGDTAMAGEGPVAPAVVPGPVPT
jgi:hypothetical protein